jgi:hypothetical protein
MVAESQRKLHHKISKISVTIVRHRGALRPLSLSPQERRSIATIEDEMTRRTCAAQLRKPNGRIEGSDIVSLDRGQQGARRLLHIPRESLPQEPDSIEPARSPLEKRLQRASGTALEKKDFPTTEHENVADFEDPLVIASRSLQSLVNPGLEICATNVSVDHRERTSNTLVLGPSSGASIASKTSRFDLILMPTYKSVFRFDHRQGQVDFVIGIGSLIAPVNLIRFRGMNRTEVGSLWKCVHEVSASRGY